MLKTWKCNLKHLSAKEYEILRDMCHASKDVYNSALYNVRQHYFETGNYLPYYDNWNLIKLNNNYSYLGGDVSQQTIKSVDFAFRSFFGLCKKKKIFARIPKYLPKDGMYSLKFTNIMAYASVADSLFYVPMSRVLRKKYKGIRIALNIPKRLLHHKIHEIHIIPKHKGLKFIACFIFEDEFPDPAQLDKSKALGIDLGVNNFATCATSDGDTFIIDGRKIKSINQWYNKENARLSSIKDKQGHKGWAKLQYLKARKRDAQIQDFIYCSAKYIVNYCKLHNIGNIVLGYNENFQQSSNLSKAFNQKFTMLPFGRFRSRLQYLCSVEGIEFKLQEESYTSKASFLDNDMIPIYNSEDTSTHKFSGRRIRRGLYQTAQGHLINADVNGALNILKKSNVVSLRTLYSRGEVAAPLRIRGSQLNPNFL